MNKSMATATSPTQVAWAVVPTSGYLGRLVGIQPGSRGGTTNFGLVPANPDASAGFRVSGKCPPDEGSGVGFTYANPEGI